MRGRKSGAAEAVLALPPLLLVLLAPPGAMGASTLRFAPSPLGAGRAAIVANGREVLRLAASSGWRAFERAREVARTLDSLASDPRFDPSSIEARLSSAGFVIWGGGRKIVTVTPLDARSVGLPPEKLASLWVRALKEAFSIPHIAVRPKRVALGVGERATVFVRAVPPEFEARAEPPGVVALAVARRTVTVEARSPGRAKVVISNEAGKLAVFVESKYRAAYLRGRPRAVITSPEPSDEVLRLAALNAAFRAVALRPGVKGKVLPVRVVKEGSRPGAVVPLAAEGPDYFPWSRRLLVLPSVVPLSLPEPKLLAVSNWPERVRSAGALLTQPVEKGKPLRLLYHHLNAAGRTLEFSVNLLNFGGETAQVQVVPSCPPPEYSPLPAGHAAVVGYFERRLGRDSFVAEVGPRERCKLASHIVRPGQVVSGILEASLLSGEEVALSVEASRPGRRDWVEPLDDSDEPPGHSPYVYPEPIKTVRAEATVGGKWLYLDIGEGPLKALSSGHTLLGNYGVIYRFEIALKNPLDRRVEVSLLFLPRGGAAAGTFVIDGRLRHFGAVRPWKWRLVATLPLPPKSGRLVEVLTMPEPGSSYPASLVVRTTEPN